MEPARAREIVEQAARGAGAAHDLGIVHRDIKPGNILLAHDGTAKVADFGIALSTASERMTLTGSVIGSPHYISPEQAMGKSSGPQADVYALGIVLYELVTGRRPFEGQNAAAIAIAHVEQSPEPPSGHLPGLDPAIESIIMRCLAKDPAERFADGTSLAHALEESGLGVSTETTGEIEIPASDPMQRFAQRSIVLAVVMAVVLLTLLGAGVYVAGRSGEPDGLRPDSITATATSRSSPTPSPTTASATTSVAPSPSPVPTEQEEQPARQRRDRGSGEQPQPEPTPVDPTPEPVPSSAPTSAPSP